MPEVLMPQMGESIVEGTIVRWIRRVGDRVDRDEPLFEISTDKVDAEIPSPAAGVLAEIRAQAGQTVAVGSVVAVIDDAQAKAGVPARGEDASGRPGGGPSRTDGEGGPPTRGIVGDEAQPAGTPESAPAGARREERQKTSPLVRRIAREHSVDLSIVPGTGLGGRVTKHDILGFLEERRPRAAGPSGWRKPGKALASRDAETAEVVPMSVMRKKIAEHMMLSRRTSAHVHSVFEVDYTRVGKIRAERTGDYARQGVKLTYMSFLMKAAVDALRAYPAMNSTLDGENIVYRKHVNLGIAVSLEWGLIVPVIPHAQEKSVLDLSRAMQDLASRARAKRLRPEEVQGGTFTITNPGAFGALFGTPIINQPQVAILDVGVIEKRVAVIEDAIAIRSKGYLSLGFDHRLIDGAVADQFLSHIKRTLEGFDPHDV